MLILFDLNFVQFHLGGSLIKHTINGDLRNSPDINDNYNQSCYGLFTIQTGYIIIMVHDINKYHSIL